LLVNRNRLNELAASVGIAEIGVTTAEPLEYMRKRLEKRVSEKRVTTFEEVNPEKRLSPSALLDKCRSIVTLAIPYYKAGPTPPFSDDQPLGLVARCARSVDYHKIVEDRADKLIKAMFTEIGSRFNFRILTDRSPLLERELSLNSGLGLIGENCTLINTRYGSYVALGTILIDKPLETDSPSEPQACCSCGLCLKKCPTGALIEPFIINPHLCLSYLTQSPGIFPRGLRAKLENRIYGCDRCQEICLYNDNVEDSGLCENAFQLFPGNPLLIPLLGISQKEFEMTIGLTSAGWRGKTTLQRNVVIALGNSKYEGAIKKLRRLLENDPRPVIRLHAAWALGRIGGAKAKFALDKSYQKDPDQSVRDEVSITLGEL